MMGSASLQHRLRTHRTVVLMTFDAVALGLAWLLSVMLRYESTMSSHVWLHVAALAGAAILLTWVIGLATHVYLGRMGVATVEEQVVLGAATLAAGSAVAIANAVVDPNWVARSVPVSAMFVGFGLMLAGRAIWRVNADSVRSGSIQNQRALVIGAGFTGARLVHSMLTDSESTLSPVGFLDDDPWKRKRRHHGVPVRGRIQDLDQAVADTRAEVVVVAIPRASKELVQDIIARAATLGVSVKVMPSLSESVSPAINVRDVRDVNLSDILGRAAVETDLASIAGYLTGKRVLVTGAGGSIGSELCRQIHRFGPAELMMLDRDESGLHGVQLSIHGQAMLDSKDVILCDIRDSEALQEIFEDRRPEVVFHAAALKHLPMLEQYPHEALKTNVLGTANVLVASKRVGVQRFVNISTDKAADPTSVLGYSKRIAERLTAAAALKSDNPYISVRFGNVLGSRGSVLHAFTAQIAAGGPLTVTHPEVTRFFMTVEEAVQLVIQAGALGTDGEVMILDMGTPVKILDVARQLVALSGKEIEIVFTGLRDGEKLHEQLFSGREADQRSKHPMVSHASVAPLSTQTVHDLAEDTTRLGLLQTFADWVHRPDPRLADQHESVAVPAPALSEDSVAHV